MDQKKIRVALIGCGRIAIKHIEALTDLFEKYELVALCDVDLLRAQNKKESYEKHLKDKGFSAKNLPSVYEDYLEMIQEENFDIGIVATESGNHFNHVMILLESGRHVLVEKPIALSTEHAEEMITKAKEKGLVLSVCHQNRFNPPIQALRAAVETNRFGRKINGTARILWTRDQNYYQQAPWRGTALMDGGTLMNQCIHNIDLLLWMMDSPVKTVYAQTGTFLRNIEMEDFGAIVLRFESGAIGIVEGSACVYPQNLEETLSIFGETGTVVIGGLAVNQVQNWQFKSVEESDEQILNLHDTIDSVYGNGHAKLYYNLYNAIVLGESLVCDAVSAARAMNVILAAYRSQKESRLIEMKNFRYATIEAIEVINHA